MILKIIYDLVNYIFFAGRFKRAAGIDFYRFTLFPQQQDQHLHQITFQHDITSAAADVIFYAHGCADLKQLLAQFAGGM